MKLKPIKIQKSENTVSDMPMRMLPSLHVNDKEVPEIADWEVGRKYLLAIKVKQVSKDISEHSEQKSVHARLELVAYNVLQKKKLEDMNDKEFSEHIGKELAKYHGE